MLPYEVQATKEQKLKLHTQSLEIIKEITQSSRPQDRQRGLNSFIAQMNTAIKDYETTGERDYVDFVSSAYNQMIQIFHAPSCQEFFQDDRFIQLSAQISYIVAHHVSPFVDPQAAVIEQGARRLKFK